jgi:hypothetical protein
VTNGTRRQFDRSLVPSEYANILCLLDDAQADRLSGRGRYNADRNRLQFGFTRMASNRHSPPNSQAKKRSSNFSSNSPKKNSGNYDANGKDRSR